MPLVSGPISKSGAVVEAVVGVHLARRDLLKRNGFPAPQPVTVRALIDTGASISGVAPDVFRQLDLTPVDRVLILTPSTTLDAPHPCDEYRVSVSIVANGAAHLISEAMPVIVADGWHPTENANALIGRDILDPCVFQYFGPSGQFTLSF